MEKYRILFIDEDNTQIRKFARYVDNDPDFHLTTRNPPEDYSDILPLIREENIDAVVCDFDLREKQDVDYYGDEVIDEILNFRPRFPVFIFTSHEGDALEKSSSVHYVYEKSLMDKNQDDFSFLRKIKQEIENYQGLVNRWKEEFSSLKQKRQESSLSKKEEERLIELDNLIEELIGGKDYSFPKQIKQEQNNRLDLLINSTQKILAEIKKQG